MTEDALREVIETLAPILGNNVGQRLTNELANGFLLTLERALRERMRLAQPEPPEGAA